MNNKLNQKELSKGFMKEWHKLSIIGSLAMTIFLTLLYLYVNDKSGQLTTDHRMELFSNVIVNIIPVFLLYAMSSLFLKNMLDLKSKNDQQEMLEQIDQLYQYNFLKDKNFNDIGVNNIYDNMNAWNYREKVLVAKYEVRILVTLMEDTFFLVDKIERNKPTCKYKILMLDPESTIARKRSLELHYNEDYIRIKIESRLSELKKIKEKYGLDMEIRFYGAMRSMYLCICDKTALVGFFWHRERAAVRPMMEISLDSPFGYLIDEEFNTIWNDSRRI